jgi:hypothetical protein
MSAVRCFFLFASFSVSLLVIVISGIWILAASFGSYPQGVLYLFPWFAGACGVVGLFRARADVADKSAWELRTDVVLLVLGVIGALTSAALYVEWLGTDAMAAGLILITIFPVLPVGVATVEIKRLVTRWPTNPLPEPERLRRFLMMLIIAPLMIGTVRILAQEAAMAWYGRDFITAAHASAEKLSKGRPYCVMDYDGARSFEELDKRRILRDAVEKRVAYLAGSSFTGSPHFGIRVSGKDYWWSFRKRKFLWYRPGMWFRVPATTCAGE